MRNFFILLLIVSSVLLCRFPALADQGVATSGWMGSSTSEPTTGSPESSVKGKVSLSPKKSAIRAVKPAPVLNPGKLAVKTIRVLKPEKNTIFKEGDQATIIFESNIKAPFKIELVKFNTRKKVMDCQVGPIHQQGDSNTFSLVWTLPEWDYNGLIKYALRISNGPIEAFSQPFTIKNVTKTTVHEIFPTKTSNKFLMRYHYSDYIAEEPDPGHPRLRVGYSHAYFNDIRWADHIYRSWVFFDLSPLKGKGIVTKARLEFSLYAGCNTFTPAIKLLDERWNGEAKTLFPHKDGGMTGVNPSTLPVSRVFTWMVKPETNYGLVFIGPNESLIAKDNSKCIGLFDNVKLIVELTGQ